MRKKRSIFMIGFLAFLLGVCFTEQINIAFAEEQFLVDSEGKVIIYRVQVAAPDNKTEAENFKNKLISAGIQPVEIEPRDIAPIKIGPIEIKPAETRYRVLVGPFPTKKQAELMQEKLISLGYKDCLVVTRTISRKDAQEKGLSLSNSLYFQLLSKASTAPLYSYLKSDELYKKGMSLWTKDTASALSSLTYFAELIARYPSAPESIRARFYIGEIFRSVYWKEKTSGILTESNKRSWLIAAIDAYRDLVTNFPDSELAPLAQLNIGKCKHALADYSTELLKSALAEFKKVVDNYSKSEWAAEAQVEYAGVLFEIKKQGMSGEDAKEIIQECQKVLELYPDADRRLHATALQMQAEVYAGRDKKTAIELSKQVVEKYPDTGEVAGFAQFFIAQCYDDLGDIQNAIVNYEKFLSEHTTAFNPQITFSRALYELAMKYILIGEPEKAIPRLEEVTQKYPNSRSAQKAKEQLDILKEWIQHKEK